MCIQDKFEIQFFKTASGKEPIKEYLLSLQKENRNVFEIVLKQIKKLAKEGCLLGMPFVRKIRGDIWELRPSNQRLLYCCLKGNKIIILHAFTKKTNKTPEKELNKAEQRYKLITQGK